MPFDSLGELVPALADAGELIRWPHKVDPEQEITEIARQVNQRCLAEGELSPAILFENVRGSSIPLVVGLTGSERRLAISLGIQNFAELNHRAQQTLLPTPPSGWLDGIRQVPVVTQLSRLAPHSVKTAPCQQVVRLGKDLNLWELPFPRMWPGESVASLTAGLVATRDPVTKELHLGRQHLMVLDQQALAIRWQSGDIGLEHWQTAARLGQQLSVAISLGGDLSLLLAAQQPSPLPVTGYHAAGWWRGQPLDVVKCRTNDLEVPSQAELVLEGYFDTSEPPVTNLVSSDFYGVYSASSAMPIIRLTAMTHRATCLLPTMLTLEPPNDLYWQRRALDQLWSPVLKHHFPALESIYSTPAGNGDHSAVISLNKTKPQQGIQALYAAWGSRRFASFKTLVVVDSDCDPTNERAVWERVCRNCRPSHDVHLFPGLPHASMAIGEAASGLQKFGLDATGKLAEEAAPAKMTQPLQMRTELVTTVQNTLSQLDFRVLNGSSGVTR